MDLPADTPPPSNLAEIYSLRMIWLRDLFREASGNPREESWDAIALAWHEVFPELTAEQHKVWLKFDDPGQLPVRQTTVNLLREVGRQAEKMWAAAGPC